MLSQRKLIISMTIFILNQNEMAMYQNFSLHRNLQNFPLSSVLILVFLFIPNILQLDNLWDNCLGYLDKKMVHACKLRCTGITAICLGFPSVQQLSLSYCHSSIRAVIWGK